MASALIEKTKKYQELVAEVKAVWDEAGDDLLSEEKKQAVIAKNKEIEDVEKDLLQLHEQKNLREANSRQHQELARLGARPDFGGVPESSGDARAIQGKSLGQAVLEDPEFKAWRERVCPNGMPPHQEATIGTSPRVGVKALVTGTDVTSGGAIAISERLPLIDPGTARRPLALRQLVTGGQTGSEAVEYVRQGAFTNAAAPVAEAVDVNTGTKPQSGVALARIVEHVKTIAHWLPITRRALSDAAQLRTYIDSILLYGLEEQLEDQMVSGDGTGENFDGVLHVAGTTPQAFYIDRLTTARKARTKVRTAGRAVPNAYVMHPNDWETFDLTQDNELRYYFGGPAVVGTPRLWGLPVVEVQSAGLEGNLVCADWTLAILWDREMGNILMSDSHANFFIQNLIAILAELRAAFGIIRPSAFVKAPLS